MPLGFLTTMGGLSSNFHWVVYLLARLRQMQRPIMASARRWSSAVGSMVQLELEAT